MWVASAVLNNAEFSFDVTIAGKALQSLMALEKKPYEKFPIEILVKLIRSYRSALLYSEREHTDSLELRGRKCL